MLMLTIHPNGHFCILISSSVKFKPRVQSHVSINYFQEAIVAGQVRIEHSGSPRTGYCANWSNRHNSLNMEE